MGEITAKVTKDFTKHSEAGNEPIIFIREIRVIRVFFVKFV